MHVKQTVVFKISFAVSNDNVLAYWISSHDMFPNYVCRFDWFWIISFLVTTSPNYHFVIRVDNFIPICSIA